MNASAPAAPARRVILGRIGAPFGVRGWVRVQSHTDPIENLLDFPIWQVERQGQWYSYHVHQSQIGSNGLMVQLRDASGQVTQDRDAAARLARCSVAVGRDELPDLPNGEFYWVDLLGLNVVTEAGVALGVVDSLMQTGANDVLIVKAAERERLIPYLLGQVVLTVDVAAGRLVVDWDPEF